VIWTLLLHWLHLQKLLLSLKLSVKSKTARNKQRLEIEKATRKSGFFYVCVFEMKYFGQMICTGESGGIL